MVNSNQTLSTTNQLLMQHKQIVRFLFILISITTILNGAYFWLQRVGWSNHSTYESLIEKNDYFLEHYLNAIEDPETYNEKVIRKFQDEYRDYKREFFNFLYSTPKQLIGIKLLKYIITFALIFYCLTILLKNLDRRHVNIDIYFSIFLFFIAIGLATTILKHNWQALIAGGYVFCFTFIAIIARSVITKPNLEYLSFCLAGTIILLVFMTPIEIFYGLKVFNTGALVGKRITGFMSQPNTLGAYIVCAFAYIICIYDKKMTLMQLLVFIVTVAGLIILTGTNSSAIAFVIFLLIYSFSNRYKNIKSENKYLKHILIVVLFLTIILMLLLEGRPALQSVIGRVEKFKFYFSQDLSTLEILFGYGIGIGSNTIDQLLNYFPVKANDLLLSLHNTDSTMLLLIMQIGILGCFTFYFILLREMIRDQQLGLVYLVFILSSFTLNIIEIFPLNIILGLMLARSFSLQIPNNKNNAQLACLS